MTTLIVRHIPPCLSNEAINEFFDHFGAKAVRTMSGKMIYSAFVEFKDKDSAASAQKVLNHFKLLDRTLRVDFAQEKRGGGGLLEKQPYPVARNLGITYPSPPYLEYRYPSPNRTILDNIQHAMASVPVFYQQVLHLMNKMNLPPPFDRDLPPVPVGESRHKRKRKSKLSSDESEVHSDEEANEQERKRLKLYKDVKNLKDRTRIEIHHTTKAHFGLDGSVMLGKGPVKITVPDQEVLDKIEKNKENKLFQLEPDKKNDHLLHCASLEHLNANRMPLDEILAMSHFSNYAPGEPTDKLYIKNLPKDVTMEDFYWIYGRHFPDNKVMKRDLEIQIMSGRMKGQAFLTFPTVAIAKQGLEETNGYFLRSKPIIVSFGKHSSHRGDQNGQQQQEGKDEEPDEGIKKLEEETMIIESNEGEMTGEKIQEIMRGEIMEDMGGDLISMGEEENLVMDLKDLFADNMREK